MSTLSLTLEGAQGISAALGQLSASVETLAQRQAANTRATMAGARASGQAATATRGFGQDVQGVAGRVGQLGQQLERLGGQTGRAGTAITGISHAVSAFATATGPAGIAIAAVTTGITLMGSAFAAQREAMDAARARVEGLTTSYSDLVSEITAANAAMGLTARLEAGAGSAVENEAWIEQARRRAELASRAMAGDVGAIRTLRAEGVTGRADADPGLVDSTVAALTDLASGRSFGTSTGVAPLDDAEVRALRAIVDNADSETIRRSGIAGAAEGGRSITDMGGQDRPGSSGGGGGRSPADPMRFFAELDREFDDEFSERFGEGGAWDEAYAEATARHQEWADAIVESEREKNDYLRELDAERLAQEREKQDHLAAIVREQLELEEGRRNEVRDGLAEFSHMSAHSLDEVITAYRELQNAAKETGVTLNDTGRLMARGMTAVGNQIADTVGGTMMGAFQQAIGAWLDGSKSFVEAAEEMAKGVIRALVTESIVQAVTETARGIADLASYRYDSGAMHLAAAAAWAAVGGVAGGIGAAVGAFGGGGGGGPRQEGASQRDLADRDRDRQRESATPTVVNLYMDGLPMTQADVGAGVYRGLRTAERHGYIGPGALRRR